VNVFVAPHTSLKVHFVCGQCVEELACELYFILRTSIWRGIDHVNILQLQDVIDNLNLKGLSFL
jgi:hypothetical protein